MGYNNFFFMCLLGINISLYPMKALELQSTSCLREKWLALHTVDDRLDMLTQIIRIKPYCLILFWDERLTEIEQQEFKEKLSREEWDYVQKMLSDSSKSYDDANKQLLHNELGNKIEVIGVDIENPILFDISYIIE